VTAAIGDLETKRRDLERSLSDLGEIRARCEAHLKKRV
jgi:hypothetical protein